MPPAALIPRRTDVAGTWFAQTSAGDAIVLAWQVPGPDPFQLDHGVVVWRRFTDGGAPWRPVFGETYDASGTPVLGITATTQDVTGDGSEDALVFAETGGSGGCGIYSVLDLAAGTKVYRRSVCDTQIAPSTPAGRAVVDAGRLRAGRRPLLPERDPGDGPHVRRGRRVAHRLEHHLADVNLTAPSRCSAACRPS